MVGKTEMSDVLTEVCKMDPNFNLEKFIRWCQFSVIPNILEVSTNHSSKGLTLKAPRKKMNLKMSSAEVVFCKKVPNITDKLIIEAHRVDPEQTAPIGAVRSGSTLFAIEVT